MVFYLWSSRRSLPACGEFNNLLTWPGQILEVAANIAEPCKQIAVADEHLSNPKPEVVSSLSSDHTIPYQSLSSDQQGQKNWIGMLGRWHGRQFEYVWWWGNACVSTAPVYILQRCNPRQTTTFPPKQSFSSLSNYWFCEGWRAFDGIKCQCSHWTECDSAWWDHSLLLTTSSPPFPQITSNQFSNLSHFFHLEY